MNLNRIILSTVVSVVLLSTAALAPVRAEGLDVSDYNITGYTFDSDAVSESDSGLLFETSRFKPLMRLNVSSMCITR